MILLILIISVLPPLGLEVSNTFRHQNHIYRIWFSASLPYLITRYFSSGPPENI